MAWQAAIDGATPPPRQRLTARQPPVSWGRFPTPLTPIVGRQAETKHLLGHIGDPAVRLIVITGPGGVGKTRLAIHVAEQARAAGVSPIWYVELAAILDPSLVVPSIARALDIWDGAQTPVMQRLIATIGARDALLVLDNFEQVVGAAPALAELLVGCPRLTVLVTSRSVLHLSGEHAIALSPLPLRGAVTADAVALFAERAREARASFALDDDNLAAVIAICERLDGLPLAIELAAARMANHALQTLLPRPDAALASVTDKGADPATHLQPMHKAIDWSYRLLPEPERRLFRRLSVFVGGFSIDAARAIGLDDATDNAWLAIDAVASLVDQSLLTQSDGPEGEPRFTMLETIREFGLEHLAASGEIDATRRRHADWCLRFAEGINASYRFRRDAGWRDQLEAELGNVRAALQWRSDQDDIEGLLRLATALYPLWYHLGRGREGTDWLRDGLDRADGVPDALVLRATHQAAEMLGEQCDHAAANTLAERAIELASAIGDTLALAESLYLLGKNAQLSGEVAAGRARIEEALALFEEVGAEADAAHARTYLAMLGTGRGAHEMDDRAHLEVARRCWQSELEIVTASGDITLITRARHGLAYVSYLIGDLERSLELSHEALRMRWDMGDIRIIPADFEDIADVCAATGQFAVAARLYGAASVLRDRVDTPIPWWFEAEYERELNHIRRELGTRPFDAAWRAGREMSIEQALNEALAVRVGAPPPPAHEGKPFDLTDRELQVLRHLIEGASNNEIAGALYISPKTAANHVANILGKLGAESRTAAASIALRHNIIREGR